jgi:hypothetical protein
MATSIKRPAKELKLSSTLVPPAPNTVLALLNAEP